MRENDPSRCAIANVFDNWKQGNHSSPRGDEKKYPVQNMRLAVDRNGAKATAASSPQDKYGVKATAASSPQDKYDVKATAASSPQDKQGVKATAASSPRDEYREVLRIPTDADKPAAMLPEFLGGRTTSDVDMRASVQQCSQTVNFLAQTMVDERQQLQKWMSRMEDLLEHQGTSKNGYSHSWLSKVNDIHGHVKEELKGQRAWIADRFDRLGRVLAAREVDKQVAKGTAVKAIVAGAATADAAEAVSPTAGEPDEPPTKKATLRFSVPQALHEIGAKQISPTEESDQISEPLGIEAYTPSVQGEKQHEQGPAVGPRSSTDTSSSQRRRSLCLSSESERMERHLSRMKNINKGTSTSAWLANTFRVDFDTSLFRRKPTNCLVPYVESQYFAGFSLSAVVLNAVWLGYQTQVQMDMLMEEGLHLEPEWCQTVNRVFSIIFSIELFFRLWAYRVYFFICNDKYWNMYDVLVVLGAWLEEIFDTMNMHFLRALRVIRMVRVTRVIRILRFFQNLRYLLVALLASGSILFWTLVFFIFLMYLFAVLFMQGISMWIDTTNSSLLNEVAYHYISVPETMLTLLKAVSGGVPWERLLDPLRETSPILVPIFLIYIILVSFGILNIVTAVFVEHAKDLKDRDRDLAVHRELGRSEAFGKQLRALYEEQGLCDEDVIDRDTFEDMLSRQDIQMFLQTNGIDASEAAELFNLLDRQGTGLIAVEDFVFGCQRLKGAAKGMDLVLLYDQIVEVQQRMTSMADKQITVHLDIKDRTGRISELLQAQTRHIAALSDDMRDQAANHKPSQWI